MTDDEALVALVDNELGEAAREKLLVRLEQNEALRERVEALRQSRAQIVAAFDSLLEQAPLARLSASLDSAIAGARRWPPVSWWSLAACIAVGLGLGSAATVIGLGLSDKEETNWHSAVVEYMQLYTPDTFASQNPDEALAAAELKGVGDKVGVALTPRTLPSRTCVSGSRSTSPMPARRSRKSPTPTPRGTRPPSA